MVSHEGPLLHVMSRQSYPMRLRVVLGHMIPSACAEGTASHTHRVRGSCHEHAPTGRLLHEATPWGRTARLLSAELLTRRTDLEDGHEQVEMAMASESGTAQAIASPLQEA